MRRSGGQCVRPVQIHRLMCITTFLDHRMRSNFEFELIMSRRVCFDAYRRMKCAGSKSIPNPLSARAIVETVLSNSAILMFFFLTSGRNLQTYQLYQCWHHWKELLKATKRFFFPPWPWDNVTFPTKHVCINCKLYHLWHVVTSILSWKTETFSKWFKKRIRTSFLLFSIGPIRAEIMGMFGYPRWVLGCLEAQ